MVDLMTATMLPKGPLNTLSEQQSQRMPLDDFQRHTPARLKAGHEHDTDGLGHDTDGLRETVQTLPDDADGASHAVQPWYKPQSRLSIGRFRVGLTKPS